MIDRLLQQQLEPIARDYHYWHLWRALTRCWAGMAIVGLGLIVLHQFSGWWAAWIFPWFIAATVVWALLVRQRWRRSKPDYRAIALQIEEENPKLHALVLTAVEQQPATPTSGLNYLQQRVIHEALEHNRSRPWGTRIFERSFFAQCAQWLALVMFLAVLLGLRIATPAGRALFMAHGDGVNITPGDTSIERGSGFVVLARFDGKIPAEATLVVKPVNENERRIPLAKNLDDPVFGGGVPEVNGSLSYRVEYGARRTREYTVTVFEYPKLERADAKLTFPEYTGLPEKAIADTRRISAVEGSLLDYTFFLNKPVASAKLVAKDKTVVALAADTNQANIYHLEFSIEQNRQFELELVDDAGRTNKIPPQFVIEALKNRAPDLKFVSPRGDQRLSALEEIAFQAEASDDFGLKEYGIAYTLAGQETKFVPLGTNSSPNEKRAFNHLLPLEELSAQPDQLLSYFLWADDIGPDGKLRRTSGDMYFAEIRAFEEIFREGQSMAGGQQEGGQQGGGQMQKLAQLQKQIINATWTLQRGKAASASPIIPYR